ncbi:hypothetical protein ACNKHT_27000 [Shigella flexneri]
MNEVPEGVSRLTIIRSEPQGEFPDVKYASSVSLASTAIMRRALTSADRCVFS